MIITIILSVLISTIITWTMLSWKTYNESKNIRGLADSIENLIDKKIKLYNNSRQK